MNNDTTPPTLATAVPPPVALSPLASLPPAAPAPAPKKRGGLCLAVLLVLAVVAVLGVVAAVVTWRQCKKQVCPVMRMVENLGEAPAPAGGAAPEVSVTAEPGKGATVVTRVQAGGVTSVVKATIPAPGAAPAVAPVAPEPVAEAVPTPPDPRLKVTLLVQNRAGEEFRNKIDVFQDLLMARLAEKDLAVFNPKLVIAKFEEQPPSDPTITEALKLMQALYPAQGVGPRPADSVTGNASAVRLSQLIGADYTIVATILGTGRETRAFKGEGTEFETNNQSIVTTLRATLTILDATGATVAGEPVVVKERIQAQRGLTVDRQGIADDLLDAAALKLTESIDAKIGRMRQAAPAAAPNGVSFTINTNIPACTVEVDGVTIGSAPGTFPVTPGLHQVRITREWLTPWERTVNIFAGQSLDIQMELSANGAQRFKDLEGFKQNLALEKTERLAVVGIAQEQSAAAAHAVRTVAAGQSTMLKNSNFRLRGALNQAFWGAPAGGAANVNVINNTVQQQENRK